MNVQARDVKSMLSVPSSIQGRRKAASEADQIRCRQLQMALLQQPVALKAAKGKSVTTTFGSRMRQSGENSLDTELSPCKVTRPKDCKKSSLLEKCILPPPLTSHAKLGMLVAHLSSLAVGGSTVAPAPASIDVSCTWSGNGRRFVAARLEFVVEERSSPCALTRRSVLEFTVNQDACQSSEAEALPREQANAMRYQ